MKHPILEGSGYKFYTLAWAIISIVHALVLNQYYGFAPNVAVVDSLIHNLLFAAIAPGFWYLVRFVNTSDRSYTSLVATHAFAAISSILFWFALSKFLLVMLFEDKQGYVDFLSNTLIWRGIIGFVYYSLIVLTFYLMQYYLDLQEKSGRELELKSLLNESELKMLKSQMNPHFIFNSLNSISALTVSMPERAQEMVIKLSDFLRYSIGKDSDEKNSLKEEINNVSLYLDIEKVRFGDKLNFKNEVSEACMDTLVPNLILQPLFENAIKYGVYESMDIVSIRLSCEQKNDVLELVISNDFDPEAIVKKGEGIGLDNIRRRLLLVYGRNDLLQVEKKENTFIVMLRIPTNPLENE